MRVFKSSIFRIDDDDDDDRCVFDVDDDGNVMGVDRDQFANRITFINRINNDD